MIWARDRPQYIYMSFSQRSCANKVCRLFYLFVRGIFTSFWYYFSPFVVLVSSYLVHYIFKGTNIDDLFE